MGQKIEDFKITCPKKKVLIAGGGLGGLACASNLRSDFEVTILERNSDLGGMARSRVNKEGHHSEYCWHALCCSYINMLEEFVKIPYGKQTVADCVKPIVEYIYPRDGEDQLFRYTNDNLTNRSLLSFFQQLWSMNKEISMYDMLWFCVTYLLGQFAPDQVIDSLDSMKWSKFCSKLSPELFRWAADTPAIMFGVDADNCSTRFMLNILRCGPTFAVSSTLPDHLKNSTSRFFSMNGPMNMAVITPWCEMLQNYSVNIERNVRVVALDVKSYSEVESLSGQCNSKIKVWGAWVERNSKVESQAVRTPCGSKIVQEEYIKCDYFVNALPIEEWNRILSESISRSQSYSIKHRAREYMLKNRQLSVQGFQIQFGVCIILNTRIRSCGSTIVILPDTNWYIAFRIESSCWQTGLSGETECLNVGIGLVNRKGINGKTLLDCNSKEEITHEILAELQNSKSLMDRLLMTDGNALRKAKIIHMNIWDTFFDPRTGEPKFSSDHTDKKIAYEPKFSNNVKTFCVQPDVESSLFDNLVHSSAYARTSMNIFNMEAAVTAGRLAANRLLKAENKKQCHVYTNHIYTNPVRIILSFLIFSNYSIPMLLLVIIGVFLISSIYTKLSSVACLMLVLLVALVNLRRYVHARLPLSCMEIDILQLENIVHHGDLLISSNTELSYESFHSKPDFKVSLVIELEGKLYVEPSNSSTIKRELLQDVMQDVGFNYLRLRRSPISKNPHEYNKNMTLLRNYRINRSEIDNSYGDLIYVKPFELKLPVAY